MRGTFRILGWMAAIGGLAIVAGFVLLAVSDDAVTAQIVLYSGLVLFAVAMGVGLTIGARRDKAYKESSSEAAELMGFEQSPTDPFDLNKLPFFLFDQSREEKKGFGSSQSAGRARDVKWGRWNGMDVKFFTYGYVSRSYNSSSQTWSSTEVSYRCAVTDVPARLPRLSLGAEGMFGRMASALGGGDVKTGRRDFDRTFKVHSEDEAFARALLDQEMTSWLMTVSRDRRFEIAGTSVMCFSIYHYVSPQDLVATLTEFVQRIPQTVRSAAPPA